MRTVALTVLVLISMIPVFAQKKVALVIGNADYADVPLRNPVNDATDMAATLRELGFTVTLKTNLNQRDMETAVRNFKAGLSAGDVALFYYSGHGMQVSGNNYLIPVGESIQSETDVRYNAMEAQYVMDNMQDAGARVNIIILDACRDNPFKGVRSQTKGFVAVRAPQGTFIAYSTAPETVALDGTGRNSPYTRNLISCMKLPGIEIEAAFKEVRRKVITETGNKQVPWESSSLVDAFAFKGMTSKPATVETTPVVLEEKTITQYGKLEITTEIAGALYVGGKYIKQVNANTMIALNLTEGTHKVKISGDETVEKEVTISPNQTASVTIDKRRTQTALQPCPGMPKFTDPRDSQVYPTVQIGTQCWMQKNMNYQTGNSWCYENNSSNCNTYGRLYDWQTALKVCPDGWHLPSDAEWQKLVDFLGGNDVASGKMKESATSHWSSPNKGATNSSGFSALPGGRRDDDGDFGHLTNLTYFWSSTEYFSTHARYRGLSYNLENVSRDYEEYKTYGFSCRCLRD